MGYIVTVEWGYDNHSIVLTDKEWTHISEGIPLMKVGGGYVYEGESYQDYWTFTGGASGNILIEYGEGEDRAIGFQGSLQQANIETQQDID